MDIHFTDKNYFKKPEQDTCLPMAYAWFDSFSLKKLPLSTCKSINHHDIEDEGGLQNIIIKYGST